MLGQPRTELPSGCFSLSRLCWHIMQLEQRVIEWTTIKYTLDFLMRICSQPQCIGEMACEKGNATYQTSVLGLFLFGTHGHNLNRVEGRLQVVEGRGEGQHALKKRIPIIPTNRKRIFSGGKGM